jgi:hypothetical protein
VIGAIADGIVGTVKYGHRHKAWLSALALLMTFIVGVSYLTLGALRWNPLKSTYLVNVELPGSGGLLVNQDVTLRGIPIGKIDKLSLRRDGVDAQIKINDDIAISETSQARVAGLSAAGEQYLDFDGGNGAAPFLANGSTFTMGRTEIPVTLAQLLAHSDGMLKQVDTTKLELIKKELGMSKDGPQKLDDLVEGPVAGLHGARGPHVLNVAAAFQRGSQAGDHIPLVAHRPRTRHGAREVWWTLGPLVARLVHQVAPARLHHLNVRRVAPKHRAPRLRPRRRGLRVDELDA